MTNANYMDTINPNGSAAKLDWLTLTSFEQYAYGTWKDLFPRESMQDAKVLQYVGKSVRMLNGSAFIGTAMQGLRAHHMLRLSGGSSHMALFDDPLSRLTPGILDGWAKATRADIQLTILWDGDAHDDMWRAFNRLQRASSGTVGWAESQNERWGKLATLYIGSRTSQQFMRLYMKPDEDNMRVRVELELKGNKAASAIRQCVRRDGQSMLDSWLLNHMQKNGDEIFTPFINALSGVQPERIVSDARDEPKTKQWLIQSVLPAFTRYIMSHDADPEVLDMFSRVIESKMRNDIG